MPSVNQLDLGAFRQTHRPATRPPEPDNSSWYHNLVAEGRAALLASVDDCSLARMVLDRFATRTQHNGVQANAYPDTRINTATRSTVAAATESIDKMDLLASVAVATQTLDEGAISPELLNAHAHVEETLTGAVSDVSPHSVDMFPGQSVEVRKYPPLLGSKIHPTAGPTITPRSGRAPVGRRIGRIRRYSEQDGAYGVWEEIYAPANRGPSGGFATSIGLHRGGRIGVRTTLLAGEKQKSLATAMRQCKLYRQYIRSEVFHEPRFHVLLSSNAQSDRGYMYHGIRMKAQPIDLVPEVASYAKELARSYRLPQDQWNIGVDMIVYRDGNDSIGWHADDSQGESIVLCVVVDAPDEPRPVYIRPNKRAKKLSDGDEEIQLDVGEGDAYDMDGLMQNGYEHSLPKKNGSKSPRFVLIFRHGCEASVPHDSGTAITEMAADAPGTENEGLVSLLSRLRVKPPTVIFGHAGVDEGKLYSRKVLYANGAHRADQRGINGNVDQGSDSIVVSRQNPDVREEDGLQWLRYTSSRRQGAGALCVSHNRKLPVHSVTKVWDVKGELLHGGNLMIQSGTTQFTFQLERLPAPPSDESNADEHNSHSVDEIWQMIQVSHGREPTAEFMPPRPTHDNTLPELPDDDADSYGSRSNSEPSLGPTKHSRPANANLTVSPRAPARQRECDFTNQKSILTRFGFKKGKGKLQPLLSVITKCRTRNAKAQHVRAWRNLTKEKQQQLKKDVAVAEEAKDRKAFSMLLASMDPWETPDATTIGPSLDADVQLQTNCDFSCPKSIKTAFPCERGMGKLTPLLKDIAKCPTNEKKAQYVRAWRSMTKEQQKKWKENKTIQLTDEAVQEMEIFASSVMLAQYWNESRILVSADALIELETFVSESSEVILDEQARGGRTKKSRKKPAKVKAAKDDSRNDKMAAGTEKSRSKGGKLSQTCELKRGEAQQPETTRTIAQRQPAPRFITIEEGRMQSLSYPCQATCKVGRRQTKLVKVSVKWGFQSPQKREIRAADKAVSGRKRKEPEVEQASDEAAAHTSSSKSPSTVKRSRAAEKVSQDGGGPQSYSINEGIFAWDKGHLYEAKVLKTKETKGVKHLVHYLGYNKSQDRWLTIQDMMKDTSSNREYFGTGPVRDSPSVAKEKRARRIAKPAAVQANKATERASRAKRRANAGPQGGTEASGRIVSQARKRKSSRLAVPKDPPQPKEETKVKKKRATSDDVIATKVSSTAVLKAASSRTTDVPAVGRRVTVKYDDGNLYGGMIAHVKLQRKNKASDKPAYSIRILYDDGDVANETFPGAGILLEHS
ncbi:hypothetical protein ACHAXT_001471 [Thalassiosira profunda]